VEVTVTQKIVKATRSTESLRRHV